MAMVALAAVAMTSPAAPAASHPVPSRPPAFDLPPFPQPLEVPAAAGTARGRSATTGSCAEIPGTRCPSWVSIYDNPSGRDSHGGDVLTDAAAGASRVYVTGESIAGSGSGYGTAAYDGASGAELWRARYEVPGMGAGFPVLALSADESVVVVAGAAGTVAYDGTTGAELWRNTVSHQWRDIIVSSDGSRAFLTGWIEAPGFSTDALTLALDLRSGAEVWREQYDAPEHGSDGGNALALSPAGDRLFVVGAFDARGVPHWSDYLIAAYATADVLIGDRLQWVHTYDHAELEDVATGVAIAPDGQTVFVTGRSGGSTAPAKTYEFGTVAIDAHSGERRWVQRVTDGVQPGHLHWPNGIAVAPDGDSVAVTGRLMDGRLDLYGTPLADIDWGTYLYDAGSGEQRWSARLATPGYWFEEPGDVVFAGDRVLVGGFSAMNVRANVTADFAAAAYALEDGSQEWVSRWNTSPAHADHVFGQALTAAPDGSRAYLSGTAFYYRVEEDSNKITGEGNLVDYVTLALDLEVACADC